MHEDLLGWLYEPSHDKGMSFARDDGSWRTESYAEIAQRTMDAASVVRRFSQDDKDVVCIVAASGLDFITAFMGTLAAGRTPCPLAPPGMLGDPDEYIGHATAILACADPGLVLTDDAAADHVARAAACAGIGCGLHHVTDSYGYDKVTRAAPPALGLIQFTSGSTGTPRGARIGWDSLQANVDMIAGWAGGPRPGDRLASWLPMHHDMGLIGGVLVPAAYRVDATYLRPDQMIRDPMRWLRCFGHEKATIGASPTFGLGYALKRLRPGMLRGMDFSRWRALFCGSDRVDVGTLSEFARTLAPHGFSPAALAPAYGLAEATLAVTVVPASETPSAVRVRAESLSLGRRVEVEEQAQVGSVDLAGDPGDWFVGCGRPLDGVALHIAGSRGEVLPEGQLGEIRVSGPSVGRGYHGAAASAPSRFVDGELHTGDAGFMVNGELFVVGRMGDSLSTRGRTLFAEDLDVRIRSIPDVPTGRCAALCGADRHGERVVVLAEKPPGDWGEAVAEVVGSYVGTDVPVTVVAAPFGAIARTSSGKPRRRLMWRRFLDGSLPGVVLTGSEGGEASRDAPAVTAG